jgi:hypothetical protein
VTKGIRSRSTPTTTRDVRAGSRRQPALAPSSSSSARRERPLRGEAGWSARLVHVAFTCRCHDLRLPQGASPGLGRPSRRGTEVSKSRVGRVLFQEHGPSTEERLLLTPAPRRTAGVPRCRSRAPGRPLGLRSLPPLADRRNCSGGRGWCARVRGSGRAASERAPPCRPGPDARARETPPLTCSLHWQGSGEVWFRVRAREEGWALAAP